jgi:hypothetical protein
MKGWQDFIKAEVEYFFDQVHPVPNFEVVSLKLIGSYTKPREEQKQHDIDRHGFVREPEDRDIDVEVQVRGVTQEDVERWQFSEEATDLEVTHNYDVQLQIVESTIVESTQNRWQLLAGIKE